MAEDQAAYCELIGLPQEGYLGDIDGELSSDESKDGQPKVEQPPQTPQNPDVWGWTAVEGKAADGIEYS